MDGDEGSVVFDLDSPTLRMQSKQLGEGTFLLAGQPGGPGYVAQNNTLAVFTDHSTISRFKDELVAEHLAAVRAAAHSPREPACQGSSAQGFCMSCST